MLIYLLIEARKSLSFQRFVSHIRPIENVYLIEAPQEPTRPDLISLDSPSPFVSEDSEGLSLSEEFQERWTEMGQGHDARGWCNASVTDAVRRLQQSNGARLKLLAGDLPPFIGMWQSDVADIV